MAKADSGTTESLSSISTRDRIQSALYDRYNMIKIVNRVIVCATVLFGFSLWLVDKEKERSLRLYEFIQEDQCPSKNTGHLKDAVEI